jgi:hypothetical protein
LIKEIHMKQLMEKVEDLGGLMGEPLIGFTLCVIGLTSLGTVSLLGLILTTSF